MHDGQFIPLYINSRTGATIGSDGCVNECWVQLAHRLPAQSQAFQVLGRMVVDKNVRPDEKTLKCVETFRSIQVQRDPPLAGVVIEE